MFDMNTGGLKWNIPVSLIAFGALIIACFTIMGFITFRGNTIPSSSLKDLDFKKDVNIEKSLSLTHQIIDVTAQDTDVSAKNRILTTSSLIFLSYDSTGLSLGDEPSVYLPHPSLVPDGKTYFISFTALNIAAHSLKLKIEGGTGAINQNNADFELSADYQGTLLVTKINNSNWKTTVITPAGP